MAISVFDKIGLGYNYVQCDQNEISERFAGYKTDED